MRIAGFRFAQALGNFLPSAQASESDKLDLAFRINHLHLAGERNLPIDAGSVMNLELPTAAKLNREPIRIEALNQCLLQRTDYSLNHRVRFFSRRQIQGGLRPVRELSRFGPE